MSELRSGGRLIGVRLIRDVVRSSDPRLLLSQARHALDALVDEISAIARDDSGAARSREKAAEFIVYLRARKSAPRSLMELLDRVAEAAARARYRSSRIVDFLSFWLFVVGEQFIAGLDDDATILELETSHPAIWNDVRSAILEILEAGAERLKAGRRFRLAEIHLARFRLVRARNDERSRARRPLKAPGLLAPEGRRDPDYASAVAVDLFALALNQTQQRLVVGLIPNPAGAGGRAGFGSEDYRRLWGPMRAVHTDQAYQRWNKLIKNLGLERHQAGLELVNGLIQHLSRAWSWFFPERAPFGMLRAALRELEAAVAANAPPAAGDAAVERLLHLYGETLSFIVRLATEDAENDALLLDPELEAGGLL